MNDTKGILEDIRIASPCSANWSTMTGDQQKRFCAECKLHVFDLSAMTRAQATSLLHKSTGRLCVRLWRRSDGTVLTKDCPVGLRKRLRWAWARAAAMASALLATLGCARRGTEPTPGPGPVPVVQPPLMGDVMFPGPEMGGLKGPDLVPTMGEAVVPDPECGLQPAPSEVLMGRICVDPAPQVPPKRPQ